MRAGCAIGAVLALFLLYYMIKGSVSLVGAGINATGNLVESGVKVTGGAIDSAKAAADEFMRSMDDRNTRAEVNKKLDTLLDAASQIISKPNQWMNGGDALSAYVLTAARLQLTENEEVKQFQNDALAFMVFNTEIIDQVTRSEQNTLTEGMTKFSGEANGRIVVNTAEGKASFNLNSAKTEASQLVSSTIEDLSDEEADRYGELYSSLLASYQNLVLISEGMRTN